MKRGNKLTISFFIVTIILMLLFFPAISAGESGYQIDSVELTIYRDGVVHLSQVLLVNESFPSISLELLSTSIEQIVVVDENQTVLDYDVDESNMTIFSLGASSVSLEYDTILLTEKESGVWTLLVQNPYNLTVYLPEESTIVYLNQMPASIDTVDGIITLLLYPAEWEISYILPIIGSAVFRVSNLTINPTEVEIGDEVTISVVVTNIGEVDGTYPLVLKINQVIADTKIVTLNAGSSTTEEFIVASGEVGANIVEIGELSSEFDVNAAPLFPPFTIYLIIIIAVALGGSFIFLRKRGAPSSDKIIKERPYLRKTDREVIRFLEERGGKVFEAEIRERFPDMPRTSLWRLVKRLEKLDIVTVKRIGLQNEIKFKK